MYRPLVIVAPSALAVLAATAVPENLDLFLQPLLGFSSAIYDEDKAILKDVAKDYKNYEKEDDYIAALNVKSASLGAKAEKHHKALQEKIDALGEDAKAFAMVVVKDCCELHADYLAGDDLSSLDDFVLARALPFFGKYRALSYDAKAELEKNFPITAQILKDLQLEAHIRQHLKEL